MFTFKYRTYVLRICLKDMAHSTYIMTYFEKTDLLTYQLYRADKTYNHVSIYGGLHIPVYSGMSFINH